METNTEVKARVLLVVDGEGTYFDFKKCYGTSMFPFNVLKNKVAELSKSIVEGVYINFNDFEGRNRTFGQIVEREGYNVKLVASQKSDNVGLGAALSYEVGAAVGCEAFSEIYIVTSRRDLIYPMVEAKKAGIKIVLVYFEGMAYTLAKFADETKTMEELGIVDKTKKVEEEVVKGKE